MSLLEQLNNRAGGKCELTGEAGELVAYRVTPLQANPESDTILICSHCLEQIEGKKPLDAAFWERHLPSVMWSDVPAIQVVVWRLLNRLKDQAWAADNFEMLYLDEETLSWASSESETTESVEEEFHVDSNGARLENGDTVVLTKSLDVKGSQINARIGTVVKNIRLVSDNTDQIEGKIEGQQIVILTKYVRKHNA